VHWSVVGAVHGQSQRLRAIGAPLQLIVRKDMKLDWPRAETKTDWIFMCFDEDLNKAMVSAVRETVDFLSSQKMVSLDRYEAYSITSMVADCRVTQVVDVRKGVHCMVPKSILQKRSNGQSPLSSVRY